jgi:hypothetical protein
MTNMLRVSRHLVQSSFGVLVLAGIFYPHAHASTITPSVVIVTTSSKANVTALIEDNYSNNNCANSGTDVSAVGCGALIGVGNTVANSYINPGPGVGSVVTAISGLATSQPPSGHGDTVYTKGDSYGQILGYIQVSDPRIAYLQFSDSVSGDLDVSCTQSGVGSCYLAVVNTYATLSYGGDLVTFASDYDSQDVSTSQVLSLGGSGTYDLPVPSGGTAPFTIQEELSIVVEAYAGSPSTTTSSYFAELIDPLTIQALDANMNVIPDETFEYDGLSGTTVPEPSTLVMFGTGVVGIVMAVRRRLMT